MSSEDLTGALLGVCNPLLDISAEVPQSFLDKYDVKLNNAILAEESHVPMYQDLVDNYPVQYIAGGAGQNSCRVASWMLGKPGVTSYFGAVGDDEYGNTLEKCASEEGVLVHYQKSTTTPTGTCAVLINGGERSLVANLAAANTFTMPHIETEASKKIIEMAKIYYITGFFLTVSVDTILSIAKHSAENNKTFCMNLSAPFLAEFFKDQMASCMPYCDIVFGNESEAENYGKLNGYGTDIATVALKIASQPKASGTRPRVVVITQGADATIVACEGQITTYAVDPLAKELLVDTNGAGDAFVGGFLSQLLLKKNFAECCRAGHWASRQIIQRSGCTFPATCEYS